MSLTSVEAMLITVERFLLDLTKKAHRMDARIATLVADVAALKTDVATIVAALVRGGGLTAEDVAALDASHTDFTAMHDDITKAVTPVV